MAPGARFGYSLGMGESGRLRRSFRAWLLAATLVAVLGTLGSFGACQAPRAQGGDLRAPEPPPVHPTRLEVVPHAPGPHANLSAVWWTAPRSETVEQLAERWGIHRKQLLAYNPGLRGRKSVEAGERWIVSRDGPSSRSRSIGSPNRGRVEDAIAFPEGEGWQLRSRRHRAYGTKRTVQHLAAVIREFRVNYPEVPPLLIGDIGNRRGGRAPPHRSHQSGRDVDLGYVVAEMPSAEARWKRVDLATFDAARNWEFMRMLLATGVVDHIYVDKRLQKPLLEAAKADLTPEELPRYFAVAARGKRAQAHAYISPWAGHDDHMHIRFGCSEVDVGCLSVPKARKSKNSGKSGKSAKNASKKSSRPSQG